jgi:Holliday junction DNA helicase RuvB
MTTPLAPAQSEDRTKNKLRPNKLAEVIGQPITKSLLRRAINASFALREPLPHVLLVGPAGGGKSTLSHVLGNELGVDVYDVEAPVSFDTLMQLRTRMYPGDILRIEEVHQQAIMERRGRQSATQPEVLYGLMEDRVLTTPSGPLPFPAITVIGTTTDEGMLPDSFVQRFPLRPELEEYGLDDMRAIARYNATQLDVEISPEAIAIFAKASRANPRQINNLMVNARIVAASMPIASGIGTLVAQLTLDHMQITADGLTRDMQEALRFLLTKARLETKDGEVKYQASVSSLATALGKSRDAKAIVLRVEPWLIKQGYVQVTPQGRRLTDRGIERARQLV